MLRLNKKKIYLSIFLFMFIYAPPVFPFNFMYLTAIYSFLVVVTNYNGEWQNLVRQKKIRKFNVGVFCVLLYYVLLAVLDILNGQSVETTNYLTVIYRFFSIFFIIEPTVVYVLSFSKRNEIDMHGLIECIIYAGVIESLFSIVCLISPEIKMYLNTVMFRNASSIDIADMASWSYSSRYYGFAEVMIDLFGFGSGVVTGIAIIYGYFINKKMLKYVLPLALMTVINSITGVVIIGLAVFVVLFGSKITKKKLCLMMAIPLMLIIFFVLMKTITPSSYERLMNNVWQVLDQDRVTTSKTSIQNLFSENFWALPDNPVQTFLGTGHSIFHTEYFDGSDVGVINNIWSFGIIGTIALYFSYYKFVGERKNKVFLLYRVISVFLILAMFVFEIKGVGIGCNPGNSIIILLAYTNVSLSQKAVKINKI